MFRRNKVVKASLANDAITPVVDHVGNSTPPSEDFLVSRIAIRKILTLNYNAGNSPEVTAQYFRALTWEDSDGPHQVILAWTEVESTVVEDGITKRIFIYKWVPTDELTDMFFGADQDEIEEFRQNELIPRGIGLSYSQIVHRVAERHLNAVTSLEQMDHLINSILDTFDTVIDPLSSLHFVQKEQGLLPPGDIVVSDTPGIEDQVVTN